MNPKQREFENDTILKTELELLIIKHMVHTVIETGTEYGGSANAFALMEPVKIVVTMDIAKKVGEADLAPNVHFMWGDSRKMLASAINYVLEEPLMPILFFLDAHTSIATDPCPLRQELQIIMGFTKNHPHFPRPIIVIHDCKVPGKNFGYDTYQGQDISWDMVGDLVEAIYGKDKFTYHYNTEAKGSRRGCLFIEPI